MQIDFDSLLPQFEAERSVDAAFDAWVTLDSEGTAMQLIVNNAAVVSADALRQVTIFPNLHDLFVQDVDAIEEDGFAHLLRAPSVRRVMIEWAPVTDYGASILSQCSQLEWLFVTHTEITDSAVPQLTCLSALKCLSLAETHVTDDCLRQLSQLGNLRVLLLFGTRVTLSGLQWLKRELPQCQIRGGGPYVR